MTLPTDPAAALERTLHVAPEYDEFRRLIAYHHWALPGGDYLGAWPADQPVRVEMLPGGEPGRTTYRDTLPDGRTLLVIGTCYECGPFCCLCAERFRGGCSCDARERQAAWAVEFAALQARKREEEDERRLRARAKAARKQAEALEEQVGALQSAEEPIERARPRLRVSAGQAGGGQQLGLEL
jgi:hypothetical protein